MTRGKKVTIRKRRRQRKSDPIGGKEGSLHFENQNVPRGSSNLKGGERTRMNKKKKPKTQSGKGDKKKSAPKTNAGAQAEDDERKTIKKKSKPGDGGRNFGRIVSTPINNGEIWMYTGG